jgi:cold shock CspA family protein
MKHRGTVTKFLSERNFGFIRADGGLGSGDVFFHGKQWRETTQPEPLDVVTFEISTRTDGRLKATNVRRLVNGDDTQATL